MLPNFLQKPAGTAAVLIAAVGGPYAAFETDAGVAVRRIFTGLMGAAPSNNATNSANAYAGGYSAPGSETIPSLQYGSGGYGAMPSSSGGAPLGMPISSSTPMPGSANGTGYYSSGAYASQTYPPQNYAAPPYPVNYGSGSPANNSLHPSMGNFPSTANAPNIPGAPYGGSPVNGGQPVATPVSNLPGLTGYDPSLGYGSPILESRQGNASMVPGGTQQLWDYTLGVPTLQQLQQQPGSLGGGQVHDLREVLRFDIQPGWLPQRFSRVTTVLSNVKMDGLRVPLITGTRPSDLAGTLTYFFDAAQRLQRIQLHGLTGDPSQLANLMTHFYGLAPENSLGGQLYTTRWNNRVSNVLQVAPAPVMYAGADHSKYVVFLELNQASSSFALSEEASSLLQNQQSTQRW